MLGVDRKSRIEALIPNDPADFAARNHLRDYGLQQPVDRGSIRAARCHALDGLVRYDVGESSCGLAELDKNSD